MRARTGLATVTIGGPPARRGRRRAEMTTAGTRLRSLWSGSAMGLGSSSVPWPRRPLRPVGVGGFGEAELGKVAEGERGQVLIQLRVGDGARQHDRGPRLGQRGGQRDRVFGHTARRVPVGLLAGVAGCRLAW
jgi:hypothetical protein